MKAITGYRLWRIGGFFLRPLGAYMARRRARLQALALPTLAGMMRDPECWGRSVDRLFMDGGSIRGFQAGVKLGWMEWCLDRDRRRLVMERESFGRLTDEGRAYYLERSK